MTAEFEFSQWCESNGLSPKTASILKDQDLDVAEAAKLLSTNDIAELGLTKGQTKLLTKAVNELKAPVQPGKLTAPITTTSLAKDQGLDELLKKLDNGGGLDALVSCGGLDDLPPSFDSTIPPAGQAQGDTTRVDLNPHVYLGKPNAGKEEKPLLIPDFVDVYSGSNAPEEQEIGSSGGAQVIVRAFKKKTPALDTITLSQWMGASVKILNVLLERQNMNVRAIQDYLAYIVKVSELIEEHTWQSVILYDNEYRKLQHRHGFRWGSDSQHLHTRFLKKRQGSSFSNTTPPAGARANKSSTDQPICKLYNSPTGCHWPRCKFQHICITPGCGKKHPEYTHYYGSQTSAFLPDGRN